MGGNPTFLIFVSGDVIALLPFRMSFVLKRVLSASGLSLWAMKNIVKAGVFGIYMGSTRSLMMLFLTRTSLVVSEFLILSLPLLPLLLLFPLLLASLAPLPVCVRLPVVLLMLRFGSMNLARLAVIHVLLGIWEMGVP
jgi:hypothetical protein